MLELNRLRKVSFSFHKAWNMTNDCVCYQNPDDGSKFNDREVQNNTHLKSKGQCKYKISVSKRIRTFSSTTMIAKHLTKAFILTCLFINFNLLSVL